MRLRNGEELPPRGTPPPCPLCDGIAFHAGWIYRFLPGDEMGPPMRLFVELFVCFGNHGRYYFRADGSAYDKSDEQMSLL